MTDPSRLEREAAFHDARFAGDLSREAQDRYYVAIKHGRARFEARLAELAAGADVLEVGCATGGQSAPLVASARRVLGIDVSPVAVAEARRAGVDARVGNAEATGLQDGRLDLVFGAGIVHHLDTDRFAGEAARLLRPGGRALFWEPLGHNVLFNAYRRATPEARTADEHPLLRADLCVLEEAIGPVRARYYGLATLPGVFAPDGPVRRAVLAAGRVADAALLAVPGLRTQAWYVLAEFERRRA